MDGLAFVQIVEIELKKRGIPKERFYKESGISSATMSQWRKRIYSPSSAAIKKIEEYFGIELSVEHKEKTPALTDKDERDVARTVEKIMEHLAGSEDLMFDGIPMSDEAKAAMAAAMRVGLEEAKRRNKETYTPKKYRKE
jgi:transcriptional regulator with XRE-family HTH domain